MLKEHVFEVVKNVISEILPGVQSGLISSEKSLKELRSKLNRSDGSRYHVNGRIRSENTFNEFR